MGIVTMYKNGCFEYYIVIKTLMEKGYGYFMLGKKKGEESVL